MNPLPANVGSILSRFARVLVPENNRGQLRSILRDRFLVDAVGLSEVEGRPFRIREIEEGIETMLGGLTK